MPITGGLVLRDNTLFQTFVTQYNLQLSDILQDATALYSFCCEGRKKTALCHRQNA